MDIFQIELRNTPHIISEITALVRNKIVKYSTFKFLILNIKPFPRKMVDTMAIKRNGKDRQNVPMLRTPVYKTRKKKQEIEEGLLANKCFEKKTQNNKTSARIVIISIQ